MARSKVTHQKNSSLSVCCNRGGLRRGYALAVYVLLITVFVALAFAAFQFASNKSFTPPPLVTDDNRSESLSASNTSSATNQNVTDQLINQTAAFLGQKTSWDQAAIELSTIDGPWGGYNVLVHGSGESTILVSSPLDRTFTTYSPSLPDDRVENLFTSLIANDLLTINTAPPNPQYADAGSVTITLTNAAGHSLSVTKHGINLQNARFDAIEEVLMDIAHAAEATEPSDVQNWRS